MKMCQRAIDITIYLFFFRNCDRLDVLVFKVPVTQRPNAKMRVDQLKYDVRHLLVSLELWYSRLYLKIYFCVDVKQTALQNFQQKKQRREMEQQEREQLLNRRFTSNSETSIDIDHSLQHHSSMNNAHQGVDEMIMTGESSSQVLHRL